MAVKPPKTALAGHTAGIFADMTLDGPEIGTLVAVVDRAKNLPNRKTMGKQDPYCAMRLGKEAKKTDTDRRGGQTPKWDQELRFTVHDSPDYYRLKCSVFNDDKKTDLIGEAWISLSELIKPGGGSNDLWHQLNYKGKYAGDIRVELTYYDLRPREERIAEKKKVREKVSTRGETTSPASMPRQVGPRDVRRRPLPESPVTTALASASPVDTPSASPAHQDAPAPPPKIPLDQYDVGHQYPASAPWEGQGHQPAPTYDNTYAVMAVSTHNYRQPFCEEQSPFAEHHEEQSWPDVYDQPSPLSYVAPSSSPMPASSWPGDFADWDQHSRRQPHQFNNTVALARALPCPPTHSSEPHYQNITSTTTPTNSQDYRDSSLRQSVNQEQIPTRMTQEPSSYESPPPPPMHRDTASQRKQQEYPPLSFTQRGNRSGFFASQSHDVSSRRLSVEDRSPLQQVEQQYSTHADSQALVCDAHRRQSSYDSYREDDTHQFNGPAFSSYHSSHRNSSHEMYSNHDVDTLTSTSYGRQDRFNLSQQNRSRPTIEHSSHNNSYDRRLSFNGGYEVAQYHIDSRPASQSDIAQPKVSRPEPICLPSDGANLQQRPQRKPVSEEPYSARDGRRASAVPFGPDAYDVLNPASSPVTNHDSIYQTPAQTKEASRLREVEKLRDQGPIIGNDGRVIDPSDHLPSDTWAPEPERKQRRPEHVIHVRTRNDAHSRSKPNFVETNTRVCHQRQMPMQEPPHSSPLNTPASGGRRRLQKQAPTRPLPTQPYSQTHISTSRERSPVDDPTLDLSSRQATQRYAQQEYSPTPQRPALSEYQVPVNNNYVPRGSSFQDGYRTQPAKPRMNTGREYNPRNSNVFDDPLAAEMNMIDIGPSRSGQVVLSGRRGY